MKFFFLTILCSCLCSFVEAESQTYFTLSEKYKTESQLRSELWTLVKELRELRIDYYEKQNSNAEKIKRLRGILDKLGAEVEELRKEKQNLDKDLVEIQAEIQKLKKEKEKTKIKELSAAEKLNSFITSQSEQITEGIPYRQSDRLKILNGEAASDNSIKIDNSVSGMFSRIWKFSKEELRIARSGESFTGQVAVSPERIQYTRLFRVGLLIMGYLTEHDGQAGIWAFDEGWIDATPSEAESIRRAVNILDRKQAPKYIELPVYTNPVDKQPESGGKK